MALSILERELGAIEIFMAGLAAARRLAALTELLAPCFFAETPRPKPQL
jgi:hypothetical protein